MHAISSYRGRRDTCIPTHTPTDRTDYNTLQAPQLARSVMKNVQLKLERVHRKQLKCAIVHILPISVNTSVSKSRTQTCICVVVDFNRCGPNLARVCMVCVVLCICVCFTCGCRCRRRCSANRRRHQRRSDTWRASATAAAADSEPFDWANTNSFSFRRGLRAMPTGGSFGSYWT